MVSKRAFALGFLVALVFVGVAVAFAGDDSNDSSATGGASDAQPIPAPEELRSPEAYGAEPVAQPNFITDSPDSAERIADCQQLLDRGPQGALEEDELLTCEIIVAKADGYLEPGPYSDAALDEALSRDPAIPQNYIGSN
jgi:hypothetical protein